eukprot:1024361-Heterocapsa_arctica.AAC.1
MLSTNVDDLMLIVPKEKITEVKATFETKFKVRWTGRMRAEEWTKYLGREWRRALSGEFDVRIPECYHQHMLNDHDLESC